MAEIAPPPSIRVGPERVLGHNVRSRFIPGSQQWLATGHLSRARQTSACGRRTNDPDGPPLAANASVVTAVANMPEAAARFARAGPQERSAHLRERHSPAFCKTLPLHTFPYITHAITYCSLAARPLYAGESTQLMAGRRQGHRGPLPRRPRAARRRRHGRPAPLHRGKAFSSTRSS